MLSFVLLLRARTASSAPTAAQTDEIIIVGQRIEEELAAHIERSCPPPQEIETARPGVDDVRHSSVSGRHGGDLRLWRQAAPNDVLVLRRRAGETHVATRCDAAAA